MQFLYVSMILVLSLFFQADELQTILEDYVAADDPGVVLLVTTPDMTWTGARGLADLEAETAVEADDLFRIGSITKMFVATVVLQLSEEDLIGLDDPIREYLPAEVIENIENADQVTVRQLLNMTSGIYDYLENDAFFEAIEADPDHTWTAAETVTYAYDQPAYFEPGADFYYSNTNYNLLHMIIENITGNSLAEELQTRIFEPVGMTHTYLETELGKGIVKGYTDFDDDGELDDVTLVNEGNGLGDGGIISTAADLALFPPALFDGELLEEETLDEMLDYVEDSEGGAYGLGVDYAEEDYGLVLGHSGATAGFQSNLIYLQDEEIVIVILTNNFDSEILEEMTEEVQEIVVGDE